MKYWLITTEYPPFYGGGISTYCKYTSELFHSKGHEVTVFVQDFSVSDFIEEVVNGVRVVRFLPRQTKANTFLGHSAYLSYEFAAIVRRYLSKEGVPDILESQEYGGIAYYIQQFKLLQYPLFKDLDILVTCHAPSFLCLEYNQVPIYQFPEYWTGQMEKSSIKSADLLITPSKFFVSEAKDRMDWSDIHEVHVPNPMVVTERDSEAETEFVPQRIVSFGKLAPLKGTFELLRYFETLWLEGHNLQLDLVGGTHLIFHPEGRTMGDMIKKKYHSYISSGLLKMHDEMSPEAARQFVMSAHVVLVPSLFDNLPYTVLEAMSWGKVVLASWQGGQREVIEDSRNGFLFDHNKPGEFQGKLLHILSLTKQDLKEMGQKASDTIFQRFHPEVIYTQKIKAIEEYQSSKEPRKYFPFLEPSLKGQTDSFINETDLLSVIIPYYNMGAYIEECVKSVLNADYPNKEIIIVDDGSTDLESQEKLRQLQIKYPVNVHVKKNEGLSATRNFGASKANGRFIAFLDADDMVDRTYFCKAIKVLNAYENVHFVGCWIQYFGDSTNCWPSFNPEPPYLLMHNMVNSSSLVFKKDAFLAVGQNDSSMIYGMEDWDSVISLVTNGYGGVVLPELLFHYRIRKGSMARSFTRAKRLYLHKQIVDKHVAAYRKYGAEIAHLSTNNGSGLYYDNPTFPVSTGKLIAIKEMIKEKAKRNPLFRKVAYSIYKKIN